MNSTEQRKDVKPKKSKRKKRSRGQVIERGENVYLVRIFLGRDYQTGRRTYHSETYYGSAEDAEKRCTKLLNQIDEGTFIKPSKITVNQYLDQWLDNILRQGKRLRTMEGYKEMLKIYARPTLGGMRLSDVKPLAQFNFLRSKLRSMKKQNRLRYRSKLRGMYPQRFKPSTISFRIADCRRAQYVTFTAFYGARSSKLSAWNM